MMECIVKVMMKVDGYTLAITLRNTPPICPTNPLVVEDIDGDVRQTNRYRLYQQRGKYLDLKSRRC
jgi:hypothetical protein